MDQNPYTLATGCLAGVSFLLHLMSAGNFLPDEEVWLLGTIFWYIHYWMNFVARILLLSAAAIIGAEIYKPNVVCNTASLSKAKLKQYLMKMLGVATICIFLRFLTPGPTTSFSFFYKLSLMTSFAATVLTIVEDGGVTMKNLGGTFKRRLGMKKKDHSDDSTDHDDEFRRRLGRDKSS